MNVAFELGALLHMPEIDAEPAGVEVVLQVWPRTLALQLTPPGGMVRVAVPLEDAHNCQPELSVPLFAVQVAEKLIPLQLAVHPVRVGGVVAPQIGVPEAEDCALKLVVDPEQVTVHVPSVKVTLVPEHNEAVVVPIGETVSADAM